MAKKVKKRVEMKKNMYSEGYINGQRKLANYLMGLEIDTVKDLHWLLDHLSKVSVGEEIIDNVCIGFNKLI